MRRSCLLFLSLLSAQEVEIWRDSLGTPYIFGKRDADCAYGLAWAHAEDDFGRIQYLLAVSKGKLGKITGKQGAAGDFFSYFTGAHELASRQYDSLPGSIRTLFEAYTEGINAYARSHPGEIIDKTLFPLQPIDLLRGYIIVLSSMVGASRALQKIAEGKPELHGVRSEEGSNGIALSSAKTADGHTYLVLNPHVAIEGIMRWYEAYLHSEEGWQVLGAYFPGTISPGMGVNPYLGWAMTFNWPDYVDVYKLRLHPKNPLLYRVDGRWETLSVEKVRLSVRLIGRKTVSERGWPIAGLKRPWGPVIYVKRKIWRSRFGPVFRTRQGAFAVRFAAERFYLAPLQWYQMSRARNFGEFYQALHVQGIPLFNIVYADRNDTIFYLSNALLPERTPGYDWQGILPGDTSAVLWRRYLSIEELPQVLAPRCGFVFSVNNSPFATTSAEEAPRAEAFPPEHAWQWNRHNNREFRILELLQAKPKISWEDFHAIKYDRHYPREGAVMKRLLPSYLEVPDTRDPLLREALQVLRTWDGSGMGESRAAPLLLLASYRAVQEAKLSGYFWIEEVRQPLPLPVRVSSLRYAAQQLKQHYGRVDPMLREFMNLEVKGKRYPWDGLPEQLAPSYGYWDEKRGFFKVLGGESYIQFVRFRRDAAYPEIESVVPWGISGKGNNPHFADQLPLYLERRCKPMSIDPAVIRQKARLVHRFTR
ncbi:MAG: penicillin acylase family protein [Bacteroidia bacterium]|nr:penicillin acylase family protein [Bacteroidia bacterium]MDW8236435.1 penicillin acylase family protein [Bacteroidia bacterium]